MATDAPIAPAGASFYTHDFLAAVERWPGVPGEPTKESRRTPGGVRVFHNRVLETALTKAHPISPILWTGPFIVYGAYTGFARGEAALTVGLLAAGILLWTLLEYVLHRFVFHFAHGNKMWRFMIHGYHLEFPNDKMRLVAPPFMLITYGVIVAVLYRLLLGDQWSQLFAGTAIGYVAYDWTHYYTHHFKPKRGLGRRLQRYHLKHHFQAHDRRYGISSPLWDVLFRTHESPKV
jgi:sterol desaturase/sphingolipid hydroxylase (fatty acid hydroxylase superfamily)